MNYISTALHEAAAYGNDARVKTLVGQNVKVDAVDYIGMTPLHVAAQCGHETAAQLLIDASANIDAVAISGNTPLHWAAQNGHVPVTRMLIKANSNIEAVSRTGTPLHMAARSGNEAVAQLLIKANANIEAINWNGSTSLHMAAGFGHEGMTQTLINAGANIDALNKNGETPIDCAKLNGNGSVVRMLIDAKNERNSKHTAGQLKFKAPGGGSRRRSIPDQPGSSATRNPSALSQLRTAILNEDDEAFETHLEFYIEKILQTKHSPALSSQPVLPCNSNGMAPIFLPPKKSNPEVALQSEFSAAKSLKTTETRGVIEVEVLGDITNFPTHLAVECSKGVLSIFKALTYSIGLQSGHLNVTMNVQHTGTSIFITPAEYAFLLGYADIGNYLAQSMQLDV